MAKKDQLTLADLISSHQQANTKMAAAIESQLRAQLDIKKLAEEDHNIQVTRAAESAKQQKNDDQIVEILKQGLLEKTGDGLNSNVIRLAKAISETTKSIQKSFGIKTTSDSDNPNDLTENDIEQRKVDDYQTSLLEIIARNTTPQKSKVENKPEDIWGIGAWGMALAAILGGIVGVIRGQYKAMKAFLSFITPEKFKTMISDSLKKIPVFFEEAVTKLKINLEYGINLVADFFKKRFPNLVSFLETSLTKLKNAFTFGEDSKLLSAFNSIKTALTKFITPIVEAFQMIGKAGPIAEVLESIKSWIGKVFSWVSKFAGVFKYVAIIAEKIAMPLTIIMGIWDGIKGAMEGYKKEGVMGAIQGAITGIFNSIVGSFLDMIKSMVSWVVGALGFKNAEKWLDSFSFSDIYAKFIDMLFHPIKALGEIFDSITEWFKSIEIPAIEFSVFGKKFSFGPWHPFGEEAAGAPESAKGDKKGKAEATDKAKPETTTEKTSGTLKGVTGEQVRNHPNYKKYYNEALMGNDPDSKRAADEEATMLVKEDMVKEQNTNVTPTPAETTPSAKKSNEVPAYKKQLSNLNVVKKPSMTSDAVKDQPFGKPGTRAQTAEEKRMMSDAAFDQMFGPVDGNITKKAPKSADSIYGKSADNAAAASAPTVKSSPTIVNNATQVNNQNQTAVIKTPVRNQDSTLFNYFKTRFSI